MKKLRVGIIDLVSKGPTRAIAHRVLNPNFASIMPQVVAAWCEEAGHDVTYICYTGFEDLQEELPDDIHLLFICAFTEAAQTAYALSNMFRRRGAITVVGGPHARCYPQDAARFFDYVLGFTDKEVLYDVLDDCSQYRPEGVYLAAKRQPVHLPGVRERWRFIHATIKKAPLLKIVPMIASTGCPYTCSFCIDANVPYQQLDLEELKQDLRFLHKSMKKPRISWYDPNFGVRFDDIMSAIEAAVPQGSIEFIAESSLALLTEPKLKRLARNGCQAILPGIESWFDLGNKSKSGKRQGMEKVRQVSDHVNTILRYIPYVQTNFVLGLDSDEGPEPFECTKRFLDVTPGAFPGYSLLTAFGQAAPLNLQYQRSGRVLGFPFHLLNNNQAMNVQPKGYDWRTFYDHVVDLVGYSFSWRQIFRRLGATKGFNSRLMNVVRGVSSEGFGRLNYYKQIRKRLDTDPQFELYFEQQTTKLPQFYIDLMRKDLGPLWDWLPEGALKHDPLAYLKSIENPIRTRTDKMPQKNGKRRERPRERQLVTLR